MERGRSFADSLVAAPSGGSAATNVTLTDTLPTNGGLRWATATATSGPGRCTLSGTNDSSLECTLGTLQAGASVTVTVTSTATTPRAACQTQPNKVARATSDAGQSAEDSGSVTCAPQPWSIFVDGLVGKDRRVRPTDDRTTVDGSRVAGNAGNANADFAQCSPLVGVKIGLARRFDNDWEIAGAAGVAFSLVHDDRKVREHEMLVDVEANRYLPSGVFLGTGLSIWDATRSDTVAPAWMLHFGVPLGTHPSHPTYFVGEGRLFLNKIDDVPNNYQFWAGVRVHF